MKATKEELMEYIKMMQGLMESDFQCQREVSQALIELNKLMFPEKVYDHVDILILVDTSEEMYRAVKMAQDLTQREPNHGRGYNHKDYTISNENTKIRVINLERVNTELLRGLRVDALIDNTIKTHDYSQIVSRKRALPRPQKS